MFALQTFGRAEKVQAINFCTPADFEKWNWILHFANFAVHGYCLWAKDKKRRLPHKFDIYAGVLYAHFQNGASRTTHPTVM